MPDIIKGLKEESLDRLSVTRGPELDLTANFSDPSQIQAVLEMHAHSYLGSDYVRDTCELLERLTCSYGGRHRTDIVEIGKSSTMGFNPMGVE